MTQHIRRAALISAGTVVLCLAGAAPALAGTGDPVPVPNLGPVAQTVKPVLDLLEPVVPVRVALHGVTQQAGLDDPLTTPRKHHHRQPSAHQQQAPTPAAPRATVRGTSHSRPVSHPAATSGATFSWRLPSTPLDTLAGGTTTAPAPVTATPPSVAATPVQRITTAAAEAAQGLDPRTPLGRTVLVILGTMLIGILSGGHLKTAQDRLTPRLG